MGLKTVEKRLVGKRVDLAGTMVETEAYDVIGPFAVTIGDIGDGSNGDSFVLTHIRSGYKLPGSYPTVEKASAIARGLNDLGLDWEFDGPDAVPTATRDRTKAFLALALQTEGK